MISDGPSPANVVLSGATPLAISQLTVTYVERGQRLIALDDLSFTVGTEELVALLGPSGSGKSTLLDVIAGLVEPDAGAIGIDGVPRDAAARRRLTAYMRQRDLLLPWRTASANAALALEAAGLARAAARARARAQFPAFGLGGFEDAYPAQLSGGMRQRVAFLRTVLPARRFLLLDEPFGALDALTRVEMQQWLLDHWETQRQPVLLVTHDIDEALYLADRVVVLTPRPGRLAHIEPVPLPRPRDRAMLTAPAFVAAKARLLAVLGLTPTDD